MDTPRRLAADDPALPAVLDLIRGAFAYMDGVVDPPSSVHRLTLNDLRRGEVWALGEPPAAALMLTVKGEALYLGKLAVAEGQRGRGLARRMVDTALARARALGLTSVELQTRVELTANQAAFAALGFAEVARTAHPGYDRPTSITWRRSVGQAAAICQDGGEPAQGASS